AAHAQERSAGKGRGGFGVGQRPPAHVDGLGSRIPDRHELVVARGIRVDANEEEMARVRRGKKGGRGSRGEGIGLAPRREGGGCQDERRKEGRERRSRGTHTAAEAARGASGGGLQA